MATSQEPTHLGHGRPHNIHKSLTEYFANLHFAGSLYPEKTTTEKCVTLFSPCSTIGSNHHMSYVYSVAQKQPEHLLLCSLQSNNSDHIMDYDHYLDCDLLVTYTTAKMFVKKMLPLSRKRMIWVNSSNLAIYKPAKFEKA